MNITDLLKRLFKKRSKSVKQVTVKQHYISQFILRNFIKDGVLKVFDKDKQIVLNSSSKKSMFSEYFYEHTEFPENQVENLLSERESAYAPIIKKIINHQSLSKEEFVVLLEFRHVTYYRSNEFTGFYNFRKSRSTEDWMDRWDWTSINGIYKSDDYEGDIKKSQLKAIKEVINGTDVAFKLSNYTPTCFVFESKGKKFIIGDNGSLGLGDELNGCVVIVISPSHAIMFPRITKAAEIMKKLKINNNQHIITYEDIDDSGVDVINDRTISSAFEYYIDLN